MPTFPGTPKPSLQIISAADTTESHTSFSPGKGAKSTEEGWQTRGRGSVLASEKQVVEEGELGSACTWLLTPLQMLQLPSPRRWGGVGGKCGLPQEWRKDVKTMAVGISSPHPFLGPLFSATLFHQLSPALCRCNIKGITLSQHLPPAQGDHRLTPPLRCSLSCPGKHISLLTH